MRFERLEINFGRWWIAPILISLDGTEKTDPMASNLQIL